MGLGASGLKGFRIQGFRVLGSWVSDLSTTSRRSEANRGLGRFGHLDTAETVKEFRQVFFLSTFFHALRRGGCRI